jgi:hypothetical protein
LLLVQFPVLEAPLVQALKVVTPFVQPMASQRMPLAQMLVFTDVAVV